MRGINIKNIKHLKLYLGVSRARRVSIIHDGTLVCAKEMTEDRGWTCQKTKHVIGWIFEPCDIGLNSQEEREFGG